MTLNGQRMALELASGSGFEPQRGPNVHYRKRRHDYLGRTSNTGGPILEGTCPGSRSKGKMLDLKEGIRDLFIDAQGPEVACADFIYQNFSKLAPEVRKEDFAREVKVCRKKFATIIGSRKATVKDNPNYYREWRARNRKHVNEYKRLWRAKQRAKCAA